jgi:hypothetical protein
MASPRALATIAVPSVDSPNLYPVKTSRSVAPPQKLQDANWLLLPAMSIPTHSSSLFLR